MGCRDLGKDGDKIRAGAALVVDAKLLDTGAPAPKPGIVYVVSLMRYEVLRIIRGEYPHRSIFVGHRLPDLAAAEFRVGAVYRLYLTKQFPEHAGILDTFQTDVSKAMSFFCLLLEMPT